MEWAGNILKAAIFNQVVNIGVLWSFAFLQICSSCDQIYFVLYSYLVHNSVSFILIFNIKP